RLTLAGDRSPLAQLVRLFLLGETVSAVELNAVLPLEDAGPLLTGDSTALRPAYDLAPYADEQHDWWVVSDLPDADGRPQRTDHVLGVGGASTTIAQLVVRRPVARALDIGTGCGVQALHLSTHSAAVTATDVVPRALSLAATSLALSGVEAELLGGSLQEPVTGREFDLVVCNPPFVVGPQRRFAYRDGVATSTSTGDDLSRAAVRAAAGLLAEGGTAHLLVNWLHVRGQDWRDRAAEWVSGLGCDAWLVQRDAQDPVDYVSTWARDAGPADDAEVEPWLRWFAEQRIEGVGFGWVLLRRAVGPHRVLVEEVLHPVDLPLGEEIGGWFDRVQWLRDRADDDLLEQAFRVAPAVRLDRTALPGAEGWEEAAAALRLDGGWRWTLPCDEATAALVAGCDGSRSLRAIVAVLAAALQQPVDDVAPAVCATVRGLVDRGLLLP
ncbi:MAG TPA: methyltransferase, partial [Mycobacteriales bacterium]|nr:methyltransferase [Mycobacteriales bacterium]